MSGRACRARPRTEPKRLDDLDRIALVNAQRFAAQGIAIKHHLTTVHPASQVRQALRATRHMPAYLDAMIWVRLMRGFASALLLLCTFAARSADAQDGASGQEIYRYVGANGRVVYTNNREQIPEAERSKAKVDLHRTSLNTEIGTELAQRLAQEHAALADSPYCQSALAAAKRGMLVEAWDDFAPLIVCGGALLLLFLFSPAALRRFGAPAWAKTLSMAIPILGIGGLLLFVMDGSSKSLRALKQQAEPCMHESFTRLSGAPNAAALQSRLVGSLKQQIGALDKVRREHATQLTRGAQ